MKCDNCDGELGRDLKVGTPHSRSLQPARTDPDYLPQTEEGLNLEIGGYYGGFSDNMFEQAIARLCHDCVLLVFRAIPNAVEKFNPHPSLHPFNDERCCEYGWTSIKDDEGTWVDTEGGTAYEPRDTEDTTDST